MVEISANEKDDNEFIKIVEQIVKLNINLVQPENVFIVKINYWFDFKWLNFSHKSLGEIGVWNENLRLPPFIPDRVDEETHFYKTGGNYYRKIAKPLHLYQPSEDNAHRKISLISNSAIFLWFSSETINNNHGSLMLYNVSENFQHAWYVSFLKKSSWQIYKTANTSKGSFKAMLENDYFALIR